MAENSAGGVGFGSVVSSLFGGDAGKQPGAAHARMPGRGGILHELYWPSLIPAILLIAYGLVVVWSASLTNSDANIVKQSAGVALGLVGAAIVWRYDYRQLQNMSTWLLVADVALMLLPRVPGLAYTAKGMTGWVRLGGLQFQPSEVGKLVTIFLMAALCAQFNGRIKDLRDYVKLCGTLLVPFAAIMAQPDLGTGLIILVTGAAIIICAGAKREWVIVTLIVFALGCALIVFCSMNWGFPLKTYQLNRLMVFADPSLENTEYGYNLQQAKIAVGSGGLFGKGLTAATQSQGGFLPENHTDFIFARLAEEFGFVGAVGLLGLYGWLVFSTLRLAQKLEAPFAKLVLAGVVAMWSYQLLQNVGMCIGIMPITGIPLPFVSYGATSMVVQVTAVGIVQSVYLHRTKSA